MANEEHLNLLKQGVETWNQFAGRAFDFEPDLSRADLRKMDLRGICFISANLSQADLRGADLRGASLANAFLVGANFQDADLRGADFTEAQLDHADFSRANLSQADLSYSRIVGTHFDNANLENCYLYGSSVWDVKLNGTRQSNLVVSKDPLITVDYLEVAQFIYLILNNEKIRSVIDTLTTKGVLILGRFTPERKAILNAIQEELRRKDYLPILFDFEKPSSRNLTETVSTLAHLARFVIADLTDAKSIAQELQRIVPDLPSLPVQPIILSSQYEYSMFKDFLDYHQVLTPYRYHDLESLLISLEDKVISPSIAKASEIKERRKALEAEIYK